MGQVVDLEEYRRERALRGWLEELTAELGRFDLPTPEALGWVPVVGEGGETVRWFHPHHRAFVGTVPGRPESVYLDYRDELRAWRGMTVAAVAAGFHTGLLPEPDLVLDSSGEPIEAR